jgi:hypothetical protein
MPASRYIGSVRTWEVRSQIGPFLIEIDRTESERFTMYQVGRPGFILALLGDSNRVGIVFQDLILITAAKSRDDPPDDLGLIDLTLIKKFR